MHASIIYWKHFMLVNFLKHLAIVPSVVADPADRVDYMYVFVHWNLKKYIYTIIVFLNKSCPTSLCIYIFMALWDKECMLFTFNSALLMRWGCQWCGIFYYYWWPALIKSRLLTFHADNASWKLSLFLRLIRMWISFWLNHTFTLPDYKGKRKQVKV